MQRIVSGKFRRWLKRHKDERGKAIIVSRINRLMEGMPCDVSSIGHGVSELRIHYGPGYRIYFHQHNSTTIILLAGGVKKTQRRDIATARSILEYWRSKHG